LLIFIKTRRIGQLLLAAHVRQQAFGHPRSSNDLPRRKSSRRPQDIASLPDVHRCQVEGHAGKFAGPAIRSVVALKTRLLKIDSAEFVAEE
jgi:hypothetical protein